MEEGTYYVWRNALFLLVKTMGDVMDSTLCISMLYPYLYLYTNEA